MSDIKSMSVTSAYREGWDRIFGRKKQQHWYKIFTCFICQIEVGRQRQFGVKPIDMSLRYIISQELCSSCDFRNRKE